MYVEFKVQVDKQKGKKTKECFEETMAGGIEFLRESMSEGKSNFSIVPKMKSNTTAKVIKSRKDFPKHQHGWKSIYASFENRYAFSAIARDKDTKTMKGTMRIAANVDIEEGLEDIEQDLWDDFKISFTKKPLQECDTTADQMWCGLPLDVGILIVKQVSDKILKPLWISMGNNLDDFPKYAIIKEWPGGMPWTNRKPGEKYEDNGRKTFVYMVARKDAHKLNKLLEVAKDLNLWAGTWGEKVFTLQMVPNPKEGDDVETEDRREEYQNLVRENGSLAMSRGCTVLRGCHDYETKFTLR